MGSPAFKFKTMKKFDQIIYISVFTIGVGALIVGFLFLPLGLTRLYYDFDSKQIKEQLKELESKSDFMTVHDKIFLSRVSKKIEDLEHRILRKFDF